MTGRGCFLAYGEWIATCCTGFFTLTPAPVSSTGQALSHDGRGGYRNSLRASLVRASHPPVWTPAFAGVTIDGVPTISKCDCPGVRRSSVGRVSCLLPCRHSWREKDQTPARRKMEPIAPTRMASSRMPMRWPKRVTPRVKASAEPARGLTSWGPRNTWRMASTP